MKHVKHWFLATFCIAILQTTPSTQAGLLDFLPSFGSSDAAKPNSDQRKLWQIDEFVSVRIVPREAGTPENRHPATLSTETLQQVLGLIQTPVGKGRQPLLTPQEVRNLTEPLIQALEGASAAEDVLLLSSARRDEGTLETPKAVTARLFVTPQGLQLLVNDARFEYYDRWRGTGSTPNFSYGSRASSSTTTVQSPVAINQRPGWLTFPLTPGMTLAMLPTAATTSTSSVSTLPAAPSRAQTATTAPAPVKRDAAFFDEQEQRLLAIKKLRDKDLMTEAEYQQKRKDILQGL
jgi:hypothetical protein